ncbi:hypothetical protein SEA_MADI_75 [Gordonia phage Madi]|uniref:Uncharacterized protein n=1 Tax=Gordonia phage Sienna TaxID=2759396 RepID=A0A7L7SIZ4_9CAUD|nr:hypothetical protein SEA_SIENNA_76 [Gordonia phage Sienna]QYW00878.1 hypothetical protein SEA_MADI_75 [Gordonia phage Madi]
MADEQLPEWYLSLADDNPEKIAIDRFVGLGGSLNSWGYMAPELKAMYYEKKEV